MYKIDFISAEKAADAPEAIQQIYAAFSGRGIPEPLQLLSASPAMLERQFAMMQYFMKHETLSFPLLAAIRYAVARSQQYSCCTDFNGELLAKCGMDMPAIEDMYAYASSTDASAPDSGLEEREQKLLRCVVQAVNTRESISDATLADLRSEGWSDRDIFEALAHAGSMVSTSLLDKAFRK